MYIPKNKRGNKCDSNNYRQIAISSLLRIIFDTIILDKQQMSLETEVLQFSFNLKILYCNLSFYVKRNHCLLLDASKAFDRVEYNQLLNRLRDRNMCPIVLRLLINMYINQKI